MLKVCYLLWGKSSYEYAFNFSKRRMILTLEKGGTGIHITNISRDVNNLNESLIGLKKTSSLLIYSEKSLSNNDDIPDTQG